MYILRVSTSDTIVFGERPDRVDGDVLTSFQPMMRVGEPVGKDRPDPAQVHREIFGFIPIEIGANSEDHRAYRFERSIAKAWALTNGQMIQGNAFEKSSLLGRDRTVQGRFAIKLLGCATVGEKAGGLVTKVFRMRYPTRSLRLRSNPPVDSVKLNDSRYYVSLKLGIVVRQETASGGITYLAEHDLGTSGKVGGR